MKRIIKFKTDISTRGCGFGYYKRVSDSRWYLDTFAIAKQCNVIIKKIKIYEWTDLKLSKVVVKCDNEEQWREFAITFLTHFRGYLCDIKVKI